MKLTTTAIAASLVLSWGVAQTPAQKPKYGVMKLWSQVGSFALEGEGTVEITFSGTILVSQHKGPPIVVTGKVRKEFEGMGRQAWFGTGKATVQGSWRRLQWFGKSMNAIWRGRGLAMVFGEYDAKQQTGFTQVDDLPAYPWMTTGRPFYVPKETAPGYDPKQDKPTSTSPVKLKGG